MSKVSEEMPTHWGELEIKCPFCDFLESDSWEFRMKQDETIERECGVCGSIFIATCHIDVTYESMGISDKRQREVNE